MFHFRISNIHNFAAEYSSGYTTRFALSVGHRVHNFKVGKALALTDHLNGSVRRTWSLYSIQKKKEKKESQSQTAWERLALISATKFFMSNSASSQTR